MTGPRRMVTPLERLGEVSRHYEQMADSYQAVALAAAAAEAAHKTARAKAILRFKAEEGRVSHAEAESRAEADDEVSALYLDRLTKAALAESHREKLRQLREQTANGRTAVASSRAADQIHADGLSGAA